MDRRSWVSVGSLAVVIGLTCFSLWPKADDEFLGQTRYPEWVTVGSTIQLGTECIQYLPKGAWVPDPVQGEYEVTRLEPECDCGDCVWNIYGRKITERGGSDG